MIYNIKDDRVNINLKGEIDIANADIFKSNCLEVAKDTKLGFTFECQELSFIDSTALGVFVAVDKAVKAYGKDIMLKGLKPGIKKLFVITNLDKSIRIED